MIKNISIILVKTKLTIFFTASAMLHFSFGMMQYKAMVNGNDLGTIIGRIVFVCMILVKYIYFFTRIKTISAEKQEEKSENNSAY